MFRVNQLFHDRQPVNIWNQYTKWGLPSYLGFAKTYLSSTRYIRYSI